MSEERPLIPPRDELMQMMERIYRFRMTTTSGGNLSIRDDNDDIWITPARVDKGRLDRDDIVCVKNGGSVVGQHPPSSEFPFHKAIYKARPELKGIVHAHPVALVAFSISKCVPNTRLFHQASSVCGDVAFAPYALPGSAKLGERIAECFAQGANCVILENHGVVVAGESLQHAFQRFETLEFAAKTLIKAQMIGKVNFLTEEQIQMPKKRITHYETFLPSPATTEEKELRRELCQFVRRGYDHRLLISTEGSYSARLDRHSFLMTPYQMDRSSLQIDDLVLVHKGKSEVGKIPSRACRNHAAIYETHPEINSIVNAYTVNATAFGLTGTKIDTRTIPESYIFLRDVSMLPYGVQFGNSQEYAKLLRPKEPITIMQNDGVLVLGTSILDAYDRLEVLESTAEAIINSRAIGSISPMGEEVITELRQAFKMDG
jgi:L-fuculose-phosphate aldolase